MASDYIQNSSHLSTDDAQEEEDVRVLTQTISLCDENKITKSNVWSQAFIDKLEYLVSRHNAFTRDFRNVAKSLDTATKIYSIRVDDVYNSICRFQSRGSQRMSESYRTSTNESNDVTNGANHPKKKPRRNTLNIVGNPSRINAPLNWIQLPDDLTLKLNIINDDIAAPSRLFSNLLSTKNSVLQLNNNQPYIDRSSREIVNLRDDLDYYTDQDFIKVPFNLRFGERLPIRQNGNGLAGYRIQNTPLQDSESETEHMETECVEDAAPEYEFDMNESIDWPINRSTGASLLTNNNDNVPLNISDMNNNNENGVNINLNDIRKSEYSYHAFEKVKNYWAGPSYWKVPPNRHLTQNVHQKEKKKPRAKQPMEKVLFSPSEPNGDDDSSDDETFLPTTCREANKIRKCRYAHFDPEKLKLPPRSNIPHDLFDSYLFCPSANCQHTTTSTESCPTPNDVHENDVEMDYPSIHFDDEDFPSFGESPAVNNAVVTDSAVNNEPESLHDISEFYADPPQKVERIDVYFDKRSKVVNTARMNAEAKSSIARQFEASTKNGLTHHIDTNEELEPGVATFSNVFKHLEKNKRTFLNAHSELSTGLAFFSVLSAANDNQLCLSRKPNEENDFEIAQRKLN